MPSDEQNMVRAQSRHFLNEGSDYSLQLLHGALSSLSRINVVRPQNTSAFNLEKIKEDDAKRQQAKDVSIEIGSDAQASGSRYAPAIEIIAVRTLVMLVARQPQDQAIETIGQAQIFGQNHAMLAEFLSTHAANLSGMTAQEYTASQPEMLLRAREKFDDMLNEVRGLCNQGQLSGAPTKLSDADYHPRSMNPSPWKSRP